MPPMLDPEMDALRARMPDLDADAIARAGNDALLEMFRTVAPTTVAFDPAPEIREIMAPTRAGEVRLRLYRPSTDRDLPVYVNLHGGGWVGGSIEQDDYRCRFLSHHARCLVVSVDYYLAPEHRFPVAIDQCEDIVDALRGGTLDLTADGSRIAIGGSSAGGNIAAGLAHRLCGRSAGRPAALMLTYPVCDHGVRYPSVDAFRNGYSLTEAMMRWFWSQYIRGARDLEDPQAVPMRAARLSDMPQTLVITAEVDVLRDEGEAYAARMRADGVDVTLRRMAGVIHGFLSAAPLHRQSQATFAAMAEFLRTAFHTSK